MWGHIYPGIRIHNYPFHSIYPVVPDGLQQVVADWLVRIISTSKEIDENENAIVEIEAKLGVIRDKNSNNRMNLPVLSETVISESIHQHVWFESNMTRNQHAGFNTFLNKLVEESKGDIKYSHKYEIDQYYRSRSKVRVSTDKKTGQVLAVIEKRRVADLNIFIPNCHLDCRVSINLEIPATKPDGVDVDLVRDKDRLSYQNNLIQVDLTQVSDNNSPTKIHELEFEIRNDIVDIKREVHLMNSRQSNRVLEVVGALLTGIRQCARECSKFPV